MNNNLLVNNDSKYGDDNKFESISDTTIFLPIASKLVDPLYNLGFTPNMVTILSTMFTLSSIYFLHLNKKIHAVVLFLFGYILDCVDGKIARKYSMGSDFGMVLDSTSDNISNYILFVYVLLMKKFNIKNIIIYTIILTMTYMYSISFGLSEAIASHEATGSDNFYERRLKQLEGKGNGAEKILYNIYLRLQKFSYKSYRSCYPTFDKEKINSRLKLLKIFGAGNLNIVIATGLLLV